jgi:hypothetical protein
MKNGRVGGVDPGSEDAINWVVGQSPVGLLQGRCSSVGAFFDRIGACWRSRATR